MIEQSLLEKLVEALRCMPGIGRKSAQRIAHYLLQRDREGAKHLSEIMTDAMDKIGNCERCRNFSENKLCHICKNKKRDAKTTCPWQSRCIQRLGTFKGLYTSNAYDC